MKILSKKEVLNPRQKQLEELKKEIRNCEMMIKRSSMLFEMATDENLIEARIYEMKSLSKHYDYLLASARRIMLEDDRSQTINV